MKPTKISEITKTIPATFIPFKSEAGEMKPEKPMKVVGFEELKIGKNSDVVATCKVLSYIDKTMTVPLYIFLYNC